MPTKLGTAERDRLKRKPLRDSDPRNAVSILGLLRRIHSEIAELDESGEDDSVTKAMCIVHKHIENLERSSRRRRH